MPRKHLHKPGTAFRRNYSLDRLERALEAVIDGGVSFGQAAERYGVPKATIWRKYRGMTSDKLGKPPVLNILEEKNIVGALTIAASFGYPFSRTDLKEFIQGYLNRKGIEVKCFKDNLPGDEWCLNFQNRNKELSRRNCENMKRVKAQLSPEVIKSYFSELRQTLIGVPPENILNYDETNITDDPGRPKVFVKKGSKHASRIMDTSKTSNSVMFAVFANGTLLPPYIVYKAKNLYPEWINNGPKGTRYNRSASGWFDSIIFEDWFTHLALPALRRKTGKKVLIGDNVSSHLSLNIIKLCEENNVSFVFFPTNSTHVCQPLDVAVFGPLKKAWRKVLTEWKLKNKGVVPKTEFPGLINKMLTSLEPTMGNNIKAGFQSCGIVPLDSERVLKYLITKEPGPKQNDALLESFDNIMKEKTTVNETQRPKRTKKFNVPAGKSIAVSDLDVGNDLDAESDLPSAGPSHQMTEDSDKENQTDSDINLESAESDETSTNSEDQNNREYESNDCNLKQPVSCDRLATNMFVSVTLIYNENTKKEVNKTFLGRIIKCDKDKKIFTISFLRNYRNNNDKFVYPNVEDVVDVALHQIKYIISQPVICRGIHTFGGVPL